VAHLHISLSGSLSFWLYRQRNWNLSYSDWQHLRKPPKASKLWKSLSNDELVVVSGGQPDEVVAAMAAGAPQVDEVIAAWVAGAAAGGAGAIAIANGRRGGLPLCPTVAYGILSSFLVGAVSYAYNDPYGALELFRPTFEFGENGAVCCLS
jgi:hypothetical protein